MRADAQGPSLRQLREGRGWSQDETARRLGISRNSYGSIERRRTAPRLATVRRLAELFELELEAVLELVEEEAA
jgi:repressor LexA